MKLIQLHPDDVAWMRRRLLGSVHALAVMALLSILLHFSPGLSSQPSHVGAPANIHHASGQFAATAERLPAAHASGAQQQEEPPQASRRKPNPVPPVGWRRTANGWEHMSSWPSSRPTLHQWIDRQRAEEPAWAQTLFRQLRRVPPLAFALFQLTAVGLIAAACEIRRVAV